MAPETSFASLQRFPTGISGLDTLLSGGLFRGGMVVIQGLPGVGKTILSNQICFQHVANGGNAVYVTLLAESHARMLLHLAQFQFFDPQPISRALTYVSGYRTLKEGGLDDLLKLLRDTVRSQNANLLVIDGMATAGQFAPSLIAFKQFIHELQAYLEALGCTTLLLTQPSDQLSSTVYTMVDGLIEMTNPVLGWRNVREIQIHKLRGSDFLGGRHLLRITEQGIHVYPRIESIVLPIPVARDQSRRLSFGVAQLDAMLSGGVPARSSTILVGPPGSGKTVLGLHFLAEGMQQGEAGLYFGFAETPEDLRVLARSLNLPLESTDGQVAIELIWKLPIDDYLDTLAEQLLQLVREQKTQRVFLDGFGGFHDAAPYPERVRSFFIGLLHELRILNVTAICSLETEPFEDAINGPDRHHIADVFDNVLQVRYRLRRSQLHRLITIIRLRNSAFDNRIRLFEITAHGIVVADDSESADALLGGATDQSGQPPNASSLA